MTSKARLLVLSVVLVGLLGAVTWISFDYVRDANRTTYVILFDDVRGLAANSSVFYRGIEVGRVKDIALQPEQRSVRVVVRVDSTIDLRKDALVDTIAQGLLGETIVQIVDSGSSSAKAVDGDTLQAVDRRPLEWKRTLEVVANLPTADQVQRLELRLERVEQKLDLLLSSTSKKTPARP